MDCGAAQRVRREALLTPIGRMVSNPSSAKKRVQKMTEKQVLNLASKIAKQYAAKESVRRSDVIRDVVRTRKLNLEDSIILADCIVKGLFEGGKSIAVSA